jgi:hypothetical protein
MYPIGHRLTSTLGEDCLQIHPLPGTLHLNTTVLSLPKAARGNGAPMGIFYTPLHTADAGRVRSSQRAPRPAFLRPARAQAHL